MNEQTQPALAGQVDRHVRPLVERLETAAHAWQHSLHVSREFLPSPDMLREAKAEIARLTDALRQANDQAERFERGWYLRGDALEKLQSWADAYPLTVFPEPDFAKAHELLKAGGMTLDAISASNMRHVIDGVRRLVAEGLAA